MKNLPQARKRFFGGLAIMLIAGLLFLFVVKPQYQRWQQHQQPSTLAMDSPILATMVAVPEGKPDWKVLQKDLETQFTQLCQPKRCKILKVTVLPLESAKKPHSLPSQIQAVSSQIHVQGKYTPMYQFLQDLNQKSPGIQIERVELSTPATASLSPKDSPILTGTVEMKVLTRQR